MSTQNTGLYYYDYVFIKKLRRRQKNNSGLRQAPFGFSKDKGESETWIECITLVKKGVELAMRACKAKGAGIPSAANTAKPYDKTGQRWSRGCVCRSKGPQERLQRL